VSEWLTAERAAHELAVTVRTLYRLIRSGELPAYKVGRQFRIERADVTAYLKNHRTNER
jgi:putative molybdopterin biosynthesis protein